MKYYLEPSRICSFWSEDPESDIACQPPLSPRPSPPTFPSANEPNKSSMKSTFNEINPTIH